MDDNSKNFSNNSFNVENLQQAIYPNEKENLNAKKIKKNNRQKKLSQALRQNLARRKKTEK